MDSDLNNITLTNDLLIGLYKNLLVEDAQKTQPASLQKNASKKKDEIDFIGTNKKNILVLTKTEDGLDFLKKMLLPCHLSFDDVAIVVLQKNNTNNFQFIAGNLNTQSVLMFDISPTEIDLPISFPQYQVQQYLKMKFLYLPSLQEIENNVSHKKETWDKLRKIFSL